MLWSLLINFAPKNKLKRYAFQDSIIHEDKDYIIVNKPAMISTLEDRSSSVNMLALAREFDPAAQVCHRLDKETSGVLVFARNPEAYRNLSIQFEHRKVNKIYHAVCEGIREFRNLEIGEKLRKLGNGTVCVDRRKGRDARTVVDVIKAFRKHMLVECRPATGRMHQIRVHLAWAGTPIVADETYGGHPFYLSSIKSAYTLGKDREEKPLIRRLALHAKAIHFLDLHEKAIVAEAPYPKDFDVLLHQLEKNS